MTTRVRIGASRGGAAHGGASGGPGAPGAMGVYGSPSSAGEPVPQYAFQAAAQARAFNAKEAKPVNNG